MRLTATGRHHAAQLDSKVVSQHSDSDPMPALLICPFLAISAQCSIQSCPDVDPSAGYPVVAQVQ